jgi:hypothetical protein
MESYQMHDTYCTDLLFNNAVSRAEAVMTNIKTFTYTEQGKPKKVSG